MPRTTLALCLFALLLPACGGEESEAPSRRHDPQEDLARLVFEALKHDDVDRLSPVLLKADDVTWMMKRYEENASPEDWRTLQEILRKEGGPEALADKRREKAREAFAKARATSAKAIDWSKAEFQGVVGERSRPVVENGIEGARIHFMVKEGEREELFIIPRALNIRGVWMTVEGVEHQLSPHESMTEARVLQTKQHLKGLDTVIELFRVDHGRLPNDMDELQEDSPKMGAPYLREGFADAWGNPFAYERLGDDTWRFSSAGPDGTLGTEDDITWPE